MRTKTCEARNHLPHREILHMVIGLCDEICDAIRCRIRPFLIVNVYSRRSYN